MKALIILSIFLSYHSFAQNVWLQKDSVNGAPRSVASTFVAQGEAYIVGGLDFDGFRRKMYSYSYFQDDWDNELSLGGLNGDGNERGSASSFSIKEKGYVCLGQGVTNGFFKDLWEYDPNNETWTQKADFIGSARRQASSFTIYDTAYVGLGSDINGLCKDFYKYDPALNSWTQISDFGGSARKEAVSFTMGINGYVGTGDDGVKRSDFWRYHSADDSWEQLSDFPGTARKGAVGWGMFPQGFICCGEDINNQYMNDLWEYNYYDDSWTQRTSLPGPGRTNAIVFELNGFAFVGTGYNGEFLDDMWAYQRILNVAEKNEKKILIYPNPAINNFNVSGLIGSYSTRIIDGQGRDVTNRFSQNNLNGTIHFESENIEKGIYYIQIFDQLGTFINAQKVSLN